MSNPTWSPDSWAQDEPIDFDTLHVSIEDILGLSSSSVDTESPTSSTDPRHFDHTMTADSSARLPSTTASSAPITCTHPSCNCGLPFKRRSDLKKHVERRTRPYRCLERGCSVAPFTNKHDLVRHRREVHEGAGAVKLLCPIPGCKRSHRGFNRKDNLAAHIRNMHSRAEAAEYALADVSGSGNAGASGNTSVSGSSPAELSSPMPQQYLLQEQMPQEMLFDNDLAFPAVYGGSGQLLLSLHEELGTLTGRKDALLAQLRSIESQYEAVQHTIQVLQAPPTTFDT